MPRGRTVGQPRPRARGPKRQNTCMPKEQKSRRDVINAIKTIPSFAALISAHDGHFDFELDLEVTVYGRNYNGKKVGPYVRLLTYEPGEAGIKNRDWGGNTLYFDVKSDVGVLAQPPHC